MAEIEHAPIQCTGSATELSCEAPAVAIIILHGGGRAVGCDTHAKQIVDEIMYMGHGSCRVEGLEKTRYARDEVVKFADAVRGKIRPLAAGRYFYQRKKPR